MKKIILPAFAFVALLVVSCAKEKDGYDKNLTSDTWNLSTASIVNEKVVFDDYSNGNDDVTTTDRTTIIIGSGVQSNETYHLDQQVGTPDFFSKSVDKSDISLTYKFEKEGTFVSNSSVKQTSTSSSQTGVPETTITVTAEATTTNNQGIWSWQNTADQKSQLTFDMGSFQVSSITKSELVLKLNTANTEVSKPSSSLTTTVKETSSIEIKMTR